MQNSISFNTEDFVLIAERAEEKVPVMLVGNFLSKTGIRSVCEDLAEHLSASGHQVFTTSTKTSRALRLADMMATIWRKRQRYSVALVEVYSGLAFLWAEATCWLLRRSHKPYVLTVHSGNLPDFAKRWPRRVQNLLCSASSVTTPSHYLFEQMSAYRHDLHVLPNSLRVSRYEFRPRQHPLPRMIWLRAFHRNYNPSLAPKVLFSILVDFPDAELIMVGPDKGDGSLQHTRQEAVTLDVVDHITLTGSIPKAQVSEWMNKGDVFLNTTNVDNTPVSVLEAMACGLCIVSTNVGGISYLLEDGFDALLVPPDDPAAMAAAVNRVLREPALAERLSFNARKKVEQYDYSVVLPQWEALVKTVAEDAGDGR